MAFDHPRHRPSFHTDIFQRDSDRRQLGMMGRIYICFITILWSNTSIFAAGWLVCSNTREIRASWQKLIQTRSLSKVFRYLETNHFSQNASPCLLKGGFMLIASWCFCYNWMFLLRRLVSKFCNFEKQNPGYSETSFSFVSSSCCHIKSVHRSSESLKTRSQSTKKLMSKCQLSWLCRTPRLCRPLADE